MAGRFDVAVESGVLRTTPCSWTAPHRWSAEDVAVHGSFTGGHLLHLAIGGCVLNDVHREAAGAGTTLDGVRVVVTGDLDPGTWASTGVEYRIEVASDAPAEEVERLLERVEQVAEIPRTVAAGVAVRRVR